MTLLEQHYQRALQMIADPHTPLVQTVLNMGRFVDEEMIRDILSDPQYYRDLAQEALREGAALRAQELAREEG